MKDEKKEKSYPMILFNSVYHKELVKDMNNVFTDKENGYNFIINCGDQVFYCHKERVLSDIRFQKLPCLFFKIFMFYQVQLHTKQKEEIFSSNIITQLTLVRYVMSTLLM